MKLTPEQLEKAVHAFHATPGIKGLKSFTGSRSHAFHATPGIKGLKASLEAAASHLQYAPEPVDGELVQRMHEAWAACHFEKPNRDKGGCSYSVDYPHERMSAALRVAAEEMLGGLNDDESLAVANTYNTHIGSGNHIYATSSAVGWLLANRRASITKPKTDPAVEAVREYVKLHSQYIVGSGSGASLLFTDDTLKQIVAAVRNADKGGAA